MYEEAILTFQAITETRDESAAIEYLSKNDWDVVAASNEFFTRSSQGRTEDRPEEEGKLREDPGVRTEEEEKENTGWLRSVWNGLSRIGTGTIGLVTGVFSSLTECQSSSSWTREENSPLSLAVVQLLQTVSPPTVSLSFETQGYRRAALHASMQKRPLLVFLHNSDLTPEILREVLFTSVVVSIARENFVVCVLDQRSPDHGKLIAEVSSGDWMEQNTPNPVFVAVYMISRVQQLILGSVPVLETEAEVVDFLERTLSQAENVARDLEEDELHPQDDERILQDRLLREEQEAAFREAELIASQREMEERETQRRLAEHEAKLAEIRARKLQALGPEPSLSAPDSTEIAFRLPDGSKLTRRFVQTAPVEVLYTFIDSLPSQELSEFEITTSFPSHPLTDMEKTLKEEALVPRALLHVREVS